MSLNRLIVQLTLLEGGGVGNLLGITIRYVLATSIAAALVLLALTFAPVVRAENAKFVTCRNEITSECLTDLGVELAMNVSTVPRYMPEVGMLAQMGRIDDALTLELRIEEAKARPTENVEGTVNRRMASHRITAAIRRSESLKLAVETTPSVDPGVLWISALDLLERNPYGPSTGVRRTPDDETLIIVSDMAAMIAAMALNEAERPRISHLVYAAELQAALGNRAEVIQLLEQIPQTEDLRINLTEDLVRLIGSETALRLYSEAGGSRPNILLTAASAEPDSDRSTAYLERAYEEFSDEKPWPDFDWMERTVRRSADLDHANLALQLARDLAFQAQTEPSALPVFPHIKATRALIAAQADETEIRQSLELAEGFFPQNDKEVVGIGVVSGPIVWGRSGLDAQARREIAHLRALLGDLDKAVQMIDGIEDPVFAWNDMLTSDIPIEHLNALLDAANRVLSVEEYSYVRAQLAAEMSRSDKTEAQASWAIWTATAILEAEQLTGDRAVIIYTSLARIGASQDDQNIKGLALTRMAQAALSSREYGDLIKAGFQWYQASLGP